ncbi:PASTA domain-containing protein [Sphingobacterium sp. DK4209]|uniref:PASTA domain-containing protein n=1 Tax=Sphingobacterium zhuxiongii TaxID=2662364 RepID=A0A5Q0Q6D6_9SPHI|nr:MULTISPECIES: PASTA domain-containing protein [unclassified Sphingobacterium]MVZ64286.1 PASTA domain-containing protein [Sphingobacterium sp. DK4209]QGA25635.1 PASTA domain-containing protein [Sphingobacterium sp. dk4302]
MSKFFLYLRTSAFRKNLIAALIFIVVLFIVVYFGLKVYTKHGDSQEVPVLKGLHITEALKILDKAGLEYEIDSIYQMDAKPGLVIDQDPDPKSHVKGGRTIYLTIITQSAPEIAFPEIVDKTFIEASAILKNHSLKIADTTYINDIARDVILEVKFSGQTIQPGRMVPKGSRISLILGNGRGDSEVDIPNLAGQSVEEAKFALAGLGLTLGSISFSDNSRDTINARIVGQSPDTSAHVISIGSAVHVTLAMPKTTTPTPVNPTTPQN